MKINEDILIPPVAIACHDAGAANIIVNMIDEYKDEIRICVDGPAKKIFNDYFPSLQCVTLENALENAHTLLSGTGWGSFEYFSRIMAKKKNIKNIAVIDHWVNYKQRFIHNSIEVLPDQIIVTDNFAKNKAEKLFPSISIIQAPNLYLQKESFLATSFRQRQCKTPIENLLIVAEPLTIRTIEGEDTLELPSIDYLMSNLMKINLSKDLINICLRPHPSENPENYNFIRERYKDLATDFMISDNENLHEDISWADLVMGTNSFAIVVALKANVPTMSYIHPDKPSCVLPYKEILHLKNI